MLIVKHFASRLTVSGHNNNNKKRERINPRSAAVSMSYFLLGVRKRPQDAAEVLPPFGLHSYQAPRPGAVSGGGNERNRTQGASSKVGFLDSGNGTAPRCFKGSP